MFAGLLDAFRRCKRGNVAMLFALSVVPLFGAAGMALDYARAVAGRTELQTALDGAVLAGAVAAGKEVTTAQAFFNAAIAPAELDGASASFSLAAGTLSGSAQAQVPSTLLRAMHIENVAIGADAAVKVGAKGGSACILVLDPTGNQALLANSGAKITAPDCEIHVRSTANPAAIFNAGVSLDVKKICVKGANVIQNGGTLAVVETSCAAIDDPFAGTLPAAPTNLPNCLGQNETFDAKSSYTLTPCVFNNVNVNGTKTLNLSPGTYIFRGNFNMNGGTISGQGVTLYFDSGSNPQMNSNVALNLSAPTSGTYKGILIYERSTSNASWVVNDSPSSNLKGLIYLPKRDVTINSTNNVTADQVTMVVNRLILNNTNWKFAPNADMPMGPAGAGGTIALIR